MMRVCSKESTGNETRGIDSCGDGISSVSLVPKVTWRTSGAAARSLRNVEMVNSPSLVEANFLERPE